MLRKRANRFARPDGMWSTVCDCMRPGQPRSMYVRMIQPCYDMAVCTLYSPRLFRVGTCVGIALRITWHTRTEAEALGGRTFCGAFLTCCATACHRGWQGWRQGHSRWPVAAQCQ